MESPDDLAAALLDADLSPGQQRLLDVLNGVFRVPQHQGGEERVAIRPVGRYVRYRMRCDGVDFEAEYATLPWVPTAHGLYGLVSPAPDQSARVDPAARWGLTLAGAARTSEDLARAGVDFVRVATQLVDWRIQPWDVDPVRVPEGDILTETRFDTERWLGHLEVLFGTQPPLSGFLRHAPADGPAVWIVPDAAHEFVECSTPRDMVSRVLELNSAAAEVPAVAPLSPMAVVDALDHLDAAWYRAFGEGLLKEMGDMSIGARICQPVRTGAELEMAQIALGNAVNRWRPLKGTTRGKGEPMPDCVTRSVAAKGLDVDVEALRQAMRALGAVVELRNGTAHQGALGRSQEAYAALGVPSTGALAERWARICASVVTSAATVRTVIGRRD